MADTFDIITVVERTRLMPGLGFVDVEDITYKAKPSGIVGTVTIPKDQATPEHVNETITAEVQRKQALKNL
jgi:hypothetical protein